MNSFDEYVDMYGHHFSKRLYDWAVSMMRDRNGNKVTPKSQEELESFLRTHGVNLKNNKGHDAQYVYAMIMADNWGGSYVTDKQVALGVMEFLDDPDGTKTKAFDHFVVDCRTKGEPIFWEDMM